jgi:hypothetical protein
MNTKVSSALLKSFLLFMVTTFLVTCSQREAHYDSKPTDSTRAAFLPDAPQNIADSIQKQFPGAAPVHTFADSLLGYVAKKYKITTDQILVGASTCVDDIIYTKNFQDHKRLKGPFHLGGLAGFPFTGISGLNAFSHHIPEHGTMVLEIAPHIGYSSNGGWGYVLRPGQHESSTCCGALMGTLKKLEQHSLKQTNPPANDYQGAVIGNLAVQHEHEIVHGRHPLIALTKLIQQESEKQILDQINAIEMEHVDYALVLSGVLINTDYQYTDYLWLNRVIVYDAKKKVVVEDIMRTGP